MSKLKVYYLDVDVVLRLQVEVNAHNKKEAKEKAVEVARDTYFNEFVSAKADKNEYIECVGNSDELGTYDRIR